MSMSTSCAGDMDSSSASDLALRMNSLGVKVSLAIGGVVDGLPLKNTKWTTRTRTPIIARDVRIANVLSPLGGLTDLHVRFCGLDFFFRCAKVHLVRNGFITRIEHKAHPPEKSSKKLVKACPASALRNFARVRIRTIKSCRPSACKIRRAELREHKFTFSLPSFLSREPLGKRGMFAPRAIRRGCNTVRDRPTGAATIRTHISQAGMCAV